MNILLNKNLKRNKIMKQTAVEWLLNEFQEAHKDFGGLDLQWLNKFEQAKEMEKQQIIDAYLKAKGKGPVAEALLSWDKAEEYYNNTYNK